MQGGRSRLASSAVRPCPPDRFCRWSLFIALSSLEPEAFYFASDLYDPVTRIARGPVILPTAHFGLAPILILSRNPRTHSRAGYVQHSGRPRFLNSSSRAVATSPVNSLTLGDHRSSSSDQFRQFSHSKYQPVERVCEVGHSVREILLSGSGAGPASPPIRTSGAPTEDTGAAAQYEKYHKDCCCAAHRSIPPEWSRQRMDRCLPRQNLARGVVSPSPSIIASRLLETWSK